MFRSYFIENKNRKQKKHKRKKSLPFLPLFDRLLLKVEICPCLQVQLFADLTLRALGGVHLRTFIVLHEYFSLGKTSGPTMMAASSEVLP